MAKEVVKVLKLQIPAGQANPSPPVGPALGQLAGGRSVDQLLADYPYLEHEDVLAALEYAAAVVDQRELPLARSA